MFREAQFVADKLRLGIVVRVVKTGPSTVLLYIENGEQQEITGTVGALIVDNNIKRLRDMY